MLYARFAHLCHCISRLVCANLVHHPPATSSARSATGCVTHGLGFLPTTSHTRDDETRRIDGSVHTSCHCCCDCRHATCDTAVCTVPLTSNIVQYLSQYRGGPLKAALGETEVTGLVNSFLWGEVVNPQSRWVKRQQSNTDIDVSTQLMPHSRSAIC